MYKVNELKFMKRLYLATMLFAYNSQGAKEIFHNIDWVFRINNNQASRIKYSEYVWQYIGAGKEIVSDADRLDNLVKEISRHGVI